MGYVFIYYLNGDGDGGGVIGWIFVSNIGCLYVVVK